MSKFKRFLAAKVLLILIAAAGLTYVDSVLPLKLGLDLNGGTQLDYSIDLSAVADEDKDQLVEGVQEVIRRRVDGLGISEPNIYSSNIGDEYHVIVELAGISDIEEAKQTVGKTIQLEFREENDQPDADKTEWADTASNAFYGSLTSGDAFEALAKEAEADQNGSATYEHTDLQAADSYLTEIEDLISGANVGDIIGPVDFTNGYTVGAGGTPVENTGKLVIQVTEKGSEERSDETEEKVSARHILIAYEGAERSSATRSKEEAMALAQELYDRIQAGENFEDLAKEYSDDAGSGANGGDLNSFGRGVMTSAFEDAAFNLEIGATSNIVETEFGFHIIQVYDHQNAETTVETVDTYAINKMFFSTAPDPWKKEAAITGEHFKHADVVLNQTDYTPVVSITFTDEGAKLFEELTSNNVGKQIAIFVGGDLISAPRVSETIAGGSAQITGDFTLEEANNLARDLNTGAIPAPIELSGQYTISASLGAEALSQSVWAGVIGLIILAIFMIAYYRVPGIIATIALAIYASLLLFFVKIALPTYAALLLSLGLFCYLVYLILKNKDSGGEKLVSFLLSCFILFFLTFVFASPITMTLAGIAGVILSIGMAVDANVLIFERTKEELREGKNLHTAIEEGFRRAWDSIRDSNFSSLITCAILFYFGSSIIRGFALNLALGILISMFSAIMLTRTFLNLAADSPLGKKEWLFCKPRKKKELNFGIIKNTKIWAVFSGMVITSAIVLTAVFGLKLGLDFTGGTMMELAFPADSNEELVSDTATDEAAMADSTNGPRTEDVTASIESVESVLTADFGSLNIVETDQGSFLIRMKHLSEDEHDAIMAQLQNDYGQVEEVRFTTVGPSIGATLKKKAFIALAITLIMIVLYIAFAFRKIPKEVSPWRFGLCAIAALVHDILVVVGVFALLGHILGVEVDALFITALLTIMGFSVHDTIVVFDRVRENLIYRKSDEDLGDSANKALNQTMARSLNTSISTLITIVALLLLGANSIFWFVFALAIGIVAGTYSSIFVASPLLVWWNNLANKK